MNVSIKRVYDSCAKTDGLRVLVDRLWPRGVKKSDAKLTLWMKEVAPSSELRTWFDHKPERWGAFQKKYIKELEKKPEVINQLYDLTRKDKVTLIYAARDQHCNNARVIADYLTAHKRQLENEAGNEK